MRKRQSIICRVQIFPPEHRFRTDSKPTGMVRAGVDVTYFKAMCCVNQFLPSTTALSPFLKALWRVPVAPAYQHSLGKPN